MNATAFTTQAGSALPIRVSPIGLKGSAPLESFLSWASRLAWSNGYRSVQRLLVTEGFNAPSVSDLGREKFKKQLVQLAGLDDGLVGALSVQAFPSSPSNNQQKAGPSSRWIIRTDMAGEACAHQVCPLCLAASEVPYWTMNSRRSYVTQCPEHGTAFLSHCPECGCQLTISKARTTELHQCERCRFDLRCAENSILSPLEQVPQHWVNFEVPMPHPCAPGLIRTQAFWVGAKVILDALFRHTIASKLRNAADIKDFRRLFEKVANRPHWTFDHHDVECRHDALLFLRWLLEDPSSRIGSIQSIVDIRTAIKYSATAKVTWAHEYFHTRTSTADRHVRSLVKPV